jgi:poly-gamma-glutamate capsule biosynthesis protein CapA/YwtB (metallophosphatase superfamily)
MMRATIRPFALGLVVALAVCVMVVTSAGGLTPAGASGGFSAVETTGTGEPTTTPTPTATPTPTPTVVPAITVAAVGDLCFDSSVKRLISSSGPKAPFGKTRSVLAKADVTVGNLECPLSTHGSPVPGKTFTFEGPPSAIRGLKWAGFDLLAQGNNHARDYGSSALKATIMHLDRNKIAHAGAGANSSSAFKATYIKRDGAKIAFLSYSQIGPASFRAGKHRSGTAYTTRLATVTKAIKRANKKADYVIVSFHWGIERQHTPTATQVKFGRAAVRAGANVVLSHHPHVIQGVEFYRKGLIAYSLGNFVFSPGSAEGHDTMILSMKLGKKGVSNVVARPAHIDPYGRPVLAKGATRARILGKIKSTSRGRGTHVSVSNGMAKLRK